MSKAVRFDYKQKDKGPGPATYLKSKQWLKPSFNKNYQ